MSFVRKRTFVFVFFLSILPIAAFSVESPSDQSKRELITQSDLLRQRGQRLPERHAKPVIEQKKESVKKNIPAGPSFRVSSFEFEGNTIFKTEELQSYAEKWIGKPISFADLEKLTEMISEHYLRHGYTTTRAYVPPQKITNGKVRIAIQEGRVGEINVEGNRWFRKQMYRKSISFGPGEFFEMSELEEAVQEINNLPDRSAKVYLEPGKKTGTTDVTLKAKDHFPVHASYEFNRRGTNLTHRERHVLHLTDNNLTGFGDQLESSLSLAEQGAILGGVFGYELPVMSAGTVYHFDAAVAKSHLQGDLRPLEIVGHSFSLVPGITQKLLEKGRYLLKGNLQFEIKDSKTLVGDDKISFDRMRVLTFGPQLTIGDLWGRTIGAFNLHVGLPGFMGGSSKKDDNASRIGSGGQFVYATANIVRLQRLPYDAMMVFQTGGQWSPRALTSLEQMNLGGMYSVRGYPENDSSGDSGYNFSAEFRIPPYFVPASWHVFGMKDKTWRDSFSFVTFVEGGQLFSHNRQQATSEKDRLLLGTGVGARLYLTQDLNMQVDYGIPFGDRSSEDSQPQLHLSVRVGF